MVMLDDGEKVEVSVAAVGATILVTNRRLLIGVENRLVLDLPFRRLRRIEFDVEKARPATLVIVPDRPIDAAQVVSIGPDQGPQMTLALSTIGRRLNEIASKRP